MKISYFALLVILLAAFNVNALNIDGISGDIASKEELKKMMKVGACMNNIPQRDQTRVEKTIEAQVKEVRMLCEKGKRAQAQNKAIQYSKDIKKDKTVKAMKKCMEKVGSDIMKDSLFYEDLSKSKQNVCDIKE